MFRKQNYLLIIILVSLGLLVGCQSSVKEGLSSIEVAASENETIIEEYLIGGQGDWGWPNPYAMSSRGPGFVRMYLVFDALVWKNQEGETIPQLAHSWTYDEESKTYTFALNEGIKWHDGKALTTEDVVFTVNYMKKHPLPWLDLNCIKEVTAIDDKQVAIQLVEAYSPFIDVIAGVMPILPAHIYETIVSPYQTGALEFCIGSGPFKLNKYVAESGNYAFSYFEDYYKGQAKVQSIKFISISPEMQPAALGRGELDMMMPFGESVQGLKDQGFDLSMTSGVGVKLLFNSNKYPYSETAFRQAIAYAIDRKELIDIAKRGNAIMGETGIVTKDSSYYFDEVPKYDYSLDKVVKLMESLGYVKKGGYYAKDGNQLEIVLLAHNQLKRDAEVLKTQLEAAGFRTVIDMKDIPSSDQLIGQWAFDMTITEEGATGDPIFFNRIMYTDFGDGIFRDHPKLIDAIQKQVYVPNEKVRKVLLEQIQYDFAEALPVYMLYYDKFYVAYNDKVKIDFTKNGYGIGLPLPYNQIQFLEE